MDPFVVGAIAGMVILYAGVGRFITQLPKCERRQNNDELSAQWLRERLLEAKQNVSILSGGLNPLVYDHITDEVVEALDRERELRIFILTGPIILTTADGNALYTLAQTERFGVRLQVQCLTETMPTHYRVVDQTHLFLEDPHDLYSSSREVYDLRHSAFKAWQYYRAFEYLWYRHPRTHPTSRLLEERPAAELKGGLP
ncbi:hypothetical protein HS121_01860 [bacterium]|nr:hypothetical protein [bacterium]